MLSRRTLLAASGGVLLLPGAAFADYKRYRWTTPHLNQVKRRNLSLQLELLGVPPHIAAVALPVIANRPGDVYEITPYFEFPAMTFWKGGRIVVIEHVVAVTPLWPRGFPKTAQFWEFQDLKALKRYETFEPACGNLSVLVSELKTCICPPERPVCPAKQY